MRSGEQYLEMNHTHFILIDDGTVRNFNIGNYRTRLAKAIAHGNAKDQFPGKSMFNGRSSKIIIFFHLFKCPL